MFRRFSTWLTEYRQWGKDHTGSWVGLQEADSEGINGFQKLAIESLKLSDIHLVFKVMGSNEKYLKSTIPSTEVDVYLYANGAQVVGEHNYFVGEEWDFRTAEDLLAKLVAIVREQSEGIRSPV